MTMQKKGLEPGLYFNLAAEVYHKDPALSRSDLKNLLDTPFSFWEQSSFNPKRKAPDETEEQAYGSAFHCLLFEPKKFEQTYQIVPIDKWDDSKIKLPHEKYFAMVEAIKVLKNGTDSKLFLSAGQPEVTIVFDDPESGFRFRTRHDYFTPVVSTDFKTAHTLHERHLMSIFDRYAYDIQHHLYTKARREFRRAFKAGTAHVYGHCDPAFFRKFIESEMDEFIFIFQRKTKPYPFLPLMPEDDTADDGANKTAQALKIYQANYRRYGAKEWPVCEGKVKRFSKFYGIRDQETH